VMTDQSSEYLDEWSEVGQLISIGSEQPQYDGNLVHVSIGTRLSSRISLLRSILDPSTSNCSSEPPTLHTGAEYSQEGCWKECAFSLTLAQCGCVSVSSTTLESTADVCSPFKMLGCTLDGSLVSITSAVSFH
jgi:Amiloride-sensitive sodium channel